MVKDFTRFRRISERNLGRPFWNVDASNFINLLTSPAFSNYLYFRPYNPKLTRIRGIRARSRSPVQFTDTALVSRIRSIIKAADGESTFDHVTEAASY